MLLPNVKCLFIILQPDLCGGNAGCLSARLARDFGLCLIRMVGGSSDAHGAGGRERLVRRGGGVYQSTHIHQVGDNQPMLWSFAESSALRCTIALLIWLMPAVQPFWARLIAGLPRTAIARRPML